jgi:hypothetical protein
MDFETNQWMANSKAACSSIWDSLTSSGQPSPLTATE